MCFSCILLIPYNNYSIFFFLISKRGAPKYTRTTKANLQKAPNKTLNPKRSTREQPIKEPNKTHKEVSPKPRKHLNPRGHKTLLHESLAFPAPRGSACNAVINGTFQIQKLSLSFGLLACYHLVPMEFIFHGIKDCQRLIPQTKRGLNSTRIAILQT